MICLTVADYSERVVDQPMKDRAKHAAPGWQLRGTGW